MTQQTRHRILVISGRAEQTQKVTSLLHECGYPTLTAATGHEGSYLLSQGSPDLIVTVLPLPHEDGLAMCCGIRSESAVPIIIVCGDSSKPSCEDALSSGADDYVVHPVDPGELSARIEAAIRRANAQPYRTMTGDPTAPAAANGVLQVGEIRLDLATCRVSLDGTVKTLTPNEFRLMAVLMREPGEVFTREELRQRVWPDDRHSLHLVEVHIANLRSKIEADPHHPDHVVTVRSRGYKFAIPE